MAADYGRNLYRQYEEELAKNEFLSATVKELKSKIRDSEKDREAEISALRAEHKKEIKAIKDEYEAVVNKLLEKIESLTEEVRKLRAQIDKNSSNSSKPPSSDGFEKAPRNIPNGREKSGRKPGGQKGHRGNIPVLIENPDETIDLNRYTCECGGDVVYTEESVRKQERDIRISVHVKEYRAGKGVCLRCGKKTETRFPEGVHNPVSVGPAAKALAALLVYEGSVSLGRTRKIVSEITGGGISLAEGNLVNHALELSEKIDPAIERIKDLLFLSPVLHKDETGMKIDGKLRYAHVLCTDKLTFYAAHEKRGTEADKAMDVLPGYGGTLVHDHYKPLYAFACGHAECNAHILRYLKGVRENEALYAPYAERMSDFLVEANDKRKESKAKGLKRFGDAEIADFEARYEGILGEWLHTVEIEETKRKGKNIKAKYKPEAEPLAKRLLKYKNEHLLFIRDFDVPFENNQAERDHRPLKTKLKVSGGFRSESGGDCYARIKSYISTLRKNKLDVFQGISLAFRGNPVIL